MINENKALISIFQSKKKKEILKPNYVFMIRKNRSFCDQTLQAVAILDKLLEIFICIFSVSILLF